MSPDDNIRFQELRRKIEDYQRKEGAFPGLASGDHLDALACQFIDSLRRVEFAYHMHDARHDPARMDPSSHMFDPLKAAVLHGRRGDVDEAWWLVFLGTHFGKHARDGWRLVRDVYGKLGQGGRWDWAAMSSDATSFPPWFEANEGVLRGSDGVRRRFSNHRRYESLKAGSTASTSRIFTSYVAWIAPPRRHIDVLREIHKRVGQDPKEGFAALYKAMDPVHRFGRLGRFDFLAMLGKLGIAPIEPGSTFLAGATGPLAGARLLFGGTRKAVLSSRELEQKLGHFGAEVGLGSQVLEDAICNWQKNPARYVRFRG